MEKIWVNYEKNMEIMENYGKIMGNYANYGKIFFLHMPCCTS
jgi:hypothetical protein